MDQAQLARDARLELQFRSARYFVQRHFARYLTRELSPMHDALIAEVHRLAHGQGRVAFEGARGHGKSVIGNLVAACYAAAFGLKKYILLIGTADGAPEHLGNIVTELEENETLLEDFGEAISPAYDTGSKVKSWNDRHVVLRNGVKISAITKGRSARGLRHGAHRPDFIIPDDVQKDQDVETYEGRERDKKWFTQQVLGCMPPGMAGSVMFLDTVKHEDCLVRWLSKNPGWTHYSFPATDVKTGKPMWLSEDELRKIRVELGETAYAKEFELKPHDPTQQVFTWDNFCKFMPVDIVFDGGLTFVRDDQIEKKVIAHDPIPRLEDERERRRSDMRKGDYASSVLAGRGTKLHEYGLRERAKRYVMDELTTRAPLETHMKWIVETARRWDMGPNDEIVVESNNFQRLAARDLRDLLKQDGLVVPVRCEDATMKKTTRLFSMEPPITREEVEFCADLSPAFMAQWDGLRRDNSHAHDDGPDATEKALRALSVVEGVTVGQGSSGAWIRPPGGMSVWRH